MKKLSLAFLMVLILMGVTSCGSPVSLSTKGNLSVAISSLVARTLLPDIDMEVDHFEVLGTGPSGASFTRTLTGAGSVTVENLLVGSWTIVVDAYNAAGQRIGSCESSATVTPNATSTVAMIVVPLTGNGAFQYVLTWPEAANITSPRVVGTIVSAPSNSFGITFGVDGTTASYDENLPAGYYGLYVTLYDGDNPIWNSNFIAFRVVAGATTSGQTDLTGDELALYGSLAITVGVNLQNPIDITLTGSASSITTAETLTVDTTVSGTPDEYAWFLDGQLYSQENLSSITVGPGFGVGRHCLSLAVVEGSIIGSEDYWFDVTPAVPSTGIAEDFNDGLAQGWVLGGNYVVGNNVLTSTPNSSEIWKSAYYSSGTFSGAFEYKATFDTSNDAASHYTKSIMIGSVSPVTMGSCDGLWFSVAGNSTDGYSWWVGKRNSSGGLDYWTDWQTYGSYPTTTTLKIVTDGSGSFYFYFNADLVYTLADTSFGTGYVGTCFYDGSGGANTFTTDDVYLTPTTVPASMKLSLQRYKAPGAMKAGASPTKWIKQ